MWARIILSVVVAGIAAGLLMGVIQHVRLTPLILEAEAFEHVTHGHGAEAHAHGAESWSPTQGLERTFYTTLTATLAAIGFALLTAGASFMANIPITLRNGFAWGLCGFVVFNLAPAIGLPPELPGMPALDTAQRQIWWTATVLLTAFGLWCLAVANGQWWIVAGLASLALPHFFAPVRPTEAGPHISSTLVAAFASNSLAANLAMWTVIGVGLGYALKKFESIFAR